MKFYAGNRRHFFELIAKRLERELALHPINLSSSDREPTSRLDVEEQKSFESLLVGLEHAYERCILENATEIAFLSAPALVVFTPVLIRTCGRCGEKAGQIADMLAIFYVGLWDDDLESMMYQERIRSLLSAQAIYLVYRFLRAWQYLYYPFDESLLNGHDIVELILNIRRGRTND